MARLRVKFQRAARARRNSRPGVAILLRRIGVPERAAADLRAPGGDGEPRPARPKGERGHTSHSQTAYYLIQLYSLISVLYMFMFIQLL